MIAGILAALGVLVALLGSYIAGTRRPSKPTGAPTPETARIETEAQQQTREIIADGEQRKQEVTNASNDSLLGKLRNRVRPRQ